MRIAIVSDIHGNRTAFDAVLADLTTMSPDLVLYGGDLADSGASPVEIVDRIRDLDWPGVMGNTDEMLWRPDSLTEFAAQSPGARSLLGVLEEMASFTRDLLCEDRLAWLQQLPRQQIVGECSLAVVHASPESLWRSPQPEAPDEEIDSVYGPLRQKLIVYGHVHRPFIRTLSNLTLVNSGSVGMPYDGDPRASYVLVEDGSPVIRRVAYDVEKEQQALLASRLPYAEWMARVLGTGRLQMP